MYRSIDIIWSFYFCIKPGVACEKDQSLNLSSVQIFLQCKMLFFVGIFLQFLSMIQGPWQLRVVHLSLELCNSSQTKAESITYQNFSSAQCKIWQFCLFLWINKNCSTNLSVFINFEDLVKRLFLSREKNSSEAQIFHIYSLSSFRNSGDTII